MGAADGEWLDGEGAWLKEMDGGWMEGFKEGWMDGGLEWMDGVVG